MRTDKNVYLPLRQVGQHLPGLPGTAGTRQIVDTHRHILQSLLERLVMLEGQHSRRHQYSHLLVVCSSLESGTDGNFRLTEAHVTTDQPVHRACAFHILLQLLRGFQLVGGILVEERSLQFVLHE